MTLLERPLPRWGKLLARAPLLLYRLRLGRLLGHRFLVVVHRGRRSGRLYRTVVEVVRWDAARREAVVASGWGERSSWWRNIQGAPAVEVWIAGERFLPEQRVLCLQEREEVLRAYAHEHPLGARALAPLLGLRGDTLAGAARRLPMIAFRAPAGTGRGHVLTHGEARRVYDRIGRLQDVQAYERRAVAELVARADFEHAHAVFELGFGTGALAERLLERHLPPDARYAGVEVSPRMRELAGRRLARYAARVELELGDGSLRLPFPDGAFDRFVAAYVLDLLSPDEIELALHEAHRLLEPGGLLCLVSLTPGRTALARLVTRIWEALWSLHSTLVGGCRPIELAPRLDSRSWSLCHDAVVARLAVSSEVLVAEKRG